MSDDADRHDAAIAWLREKLGAVRGWSRISVAAGIAASLSYAALAALIAGAAQAWIDGSAVSAAAPWLALAAVLARGACHALRDWAGARAAIVVRANARGEVLDALERLGPLRARFGDDGALATLAIEQVDALDGYVARYAPQRIVASVVPLAIVLLVLPYSWLAALLLTATAPMIPLFMMLVGYGAAAASREQADALARLGGRFLDLVRGLPTLRALAAAEIGAQRLADGAHEYRNRMLRVLRLAFLSSSVLEFFASAAIAMVALYLGLALLGRFDAGHYATMSLGSALYILLLAPEFYAPLRQLGADYHARADALVAAERIVAATHAAPPAPAPSSSPPAPRADAPLIEFENVTLRHADGRVALAGVSFRLARGERVALRGASGAGKSSVLALLAGFVVPTSGTIRIEGVDITQIDRSIWWRRLGWLEQRPEWFRRSIADNVLLGDADAARLWPALDRAELGDIVRALPHGADSVVGEADGSLSGGQLQRLALARALARDADVWLLDEPTAHLDIETAATLVATLGDASAGVTVLLATHAETPAWIDRVLVLDHGRLRDDA